MAAPTGRLADLARDEFPQTWDAIVQNVTNGDALLTRRVDTAMLNFFGRSMTVEEQDLLDVRVALYVGKSITLSLINAGIDYWSKQRVSVGARSEAITYKDRAEDLHRLREALLAETREMWPIVEPLINVITTTVTSRRSRVKVQDVTTALTPNPYAFPPRDGNGSDLFPDQWPRRTII